MAAAAAAATVTTDAVGALAVPPPPPPPPSVASALLVVAPGDSIAPALLLSVGTVAQVRSPASFFCFLDSFRKRQPRSTSSSLNLNKKNSTSSTAPRATPGCRSSTAAAPRLLSGRASLPPAPALRVAWAGSGVC